jgi:hypothetical protein
MSSEDIAGIFSTHISALTARVHFPERPALDANVCNSTLGVVGLGEEMRATERFQETQRKLADGAGGMP